MKLLDDMMLVRNLTTHTAGGLIIPYVAQIAYSMFEVVKLGPGHYDKRSGKVLPLPVKEGDKILCNIGVTLNHPIPYKGETLYVVPNAEEAIVILDEDETI